MSDLKPKGVGITLAGKEYGMRFTLNAIDDIQYHFDIPISELSSLFQDEKKRIKNLRYLLTLLINEDLACRADETGEKPAQLDERFVGRCIDTSNMVDVMGRISAAFTAGAPESDDDDEADKADPTTDGLTR